MYLAWFSAKKDAAVNIAATVNAMNRIIFLFIKTETFIALSRKV
jgi:hypothetical protein